MSKNLPESNQGFERCPCAPLVTQVCTPGRENPRTLQKLLSHNAKQELSFNSRYIMENLSTAVPTEGPAEISPSARALSTGSAAVGLALGWRLSHCTKSEGHSSAPLHVIATAANTETSTHLAEKHHLRATLPHKGILIPNDAEKQPTIMIVRNVDLELDCKKQAQNDTFVTHLLQE